MSSAATRSVCISVGSPRKPSDPRRPGETSPFNYGDGRAGLAVGAQAGDCGGQSLVHMTTLSRLYARRHILIQTHGLTHPRRRDAWTRPVDETGQDSASCPRPLAEQPPSPERVTATVPP